MKNRKYVIDSITYYEMRKILNNVRTLQINVCFSAIEYNNRSYVAYTLRKVRLELNKQADLLRVV